MPVIRCIKSNFSGAIIACCSEKGCRLRHNGLTNYIILKGERICKDRRICDCIIFIKDNGIIIGIIELKGKTIHVSEIIEKLSNGSEIALYILDKCNDNSIRFEFYHIVLSKKISTSEYKMITKRRIRIRGRSYNIIPKKCGVSFSTLISDFK